MNLEKITTLIGQLQTMLSVLDQLPPDVRKTVMGTLLANGLDARLITRNAVKEKQNLMAIPQESFEPLVTLSPEHLTQSVRDAIDSDVCHKWGIVFYVNEYGAFMAVDADMPPEAHAPKSIKDVHAWASELGIQWIKFDADARHSAALPRYEDGETQMIDGEVVLGA